MRDAERYDLLLNYLEEYCLSTLTLSFDEIYSISRVNINSAFINKKLEFERHGIQITKIDMGKKKVLFSRYRTRTRDLLR